MTNDPMSPISEPNVVFAYIGSIVPDEPDYQNPAFNRAGNMFQENLLTALKEAGLVPSLIISQRPLRAFPNSQTWLSRGEGKQLASGLNITIIPFLNFPILRPAFVGFVVLLHLIWWGWQWRDMPHKIIYTFNLTEPSGLFTLIGARLIGAKAIASVNDINVPGETVSRTFSRGFDFWLQKKLIPRFDGLVVVTKRIIEDFAPLVPYIRIEGGISEKGLEEDSKSKMPKKTGDVFEIVSVGTLNIANGIKELLNAFSYLPDHGYRLQIAGTGPLVKMVEKAAAMDPRIEYVGYLPFEEILELYKTADVLVNMRLTEAVSTHYFFPSKVMEYMASGVPVITTCTGHIEDEYHDMVFLLRDESPQGLARIIEQVASMDPEIRARKGQAAQNYIRTHNTWEAQGRRVVKFICDEVLHLRLNREVEYG